MTPQPDKEQAVREIYLLLRLAAAGRQPVAAVYDDLSRLLCPHVLGRKAGRLHTFFDQFGGASHRGLPMVPDGLGGWRCLAVEKLSQVELRATHGTPNHAPRGKLVLMKSISTSTLSRGKIRNKGSEGVAAATGAPRRCAASRSSADYGARGVRGDPRGWKSGTGLGATNPR
jgi:hypothetical protein